MWEDTGASGRSGVGVGSLMMLPNGVLNYVCGDMQRFGSDGQPRCHIVSFLFDVHAVIGKEPASVGETADAPSGQVACWQGADATGPNTDIVLKNLVVENVENSFDTSGTFKFQAQETGWYLVLGTFFFTGHATNEQTILIYDEDTGTFLATPSHAGDLNSQIWLIRAIMPTNQTNTGFAVVYLRAGQRIKVRTGANTNIGGTSVTNFLLVKRIL